MYDRPIAVLFDLDGTLIDSIALLLGSLRHAFDGYAGRAPTDEEWVAGIGTPLGRQLAPFAPTIQELDRLTTRYRSYQREHHDQFTALYPGTMDVILRLHANGHPMGIVTSKSNAMMDRTLAFTGLAAYMQSTIGCDSCELHKPDPLPVRLALTELGYSENEAVFIGDSPHDMNAGNAANVTTIAALWGPFTKEALEPSKPDYFLDSITELPQLIERIQSARLV